MRNFLLGALIVGAPLVSAAPARAETIAGAGLSFGTDIKRPGLSLNGWKPLGDSFRVGGEITGFYPQSNTDNPGFELVTWLLAADIGASYTVLDSNPVWLYLNGGMHVDWGYALAYLEPDDGTSDQTESEFGFGAFAGIGLEVDAGFAAWFAEARGIVATSEFDQVLLTTGLRFWFR